MHIGQLSAVRRSERTGIRTTHGDWLCLRGVEVHVHTWCWLCLEPAIVCFDPFCLLSAEAKLQLLCHGGTITNCGFGGTGSGSTALSSMHVGVGDG